MSEVVKRLMEQIKLRSSQHNARNVKLKDQLRIRNNLSRQNPLIIRRRFTQKSTQNTSQDYFTRLVNSNPKPPVLRSVHHPVVIHLLKLANSANYREYRRLVLLSSLKLIKEYCARNGPCSRIYTTSHSNKLLSDPDVKFEKVLIISKKLLQKIGSLNSYNLGLLAEVPYPEPSINLPNPKLILSVCPYLGASSQASTAVNRITASNGTNIETNLTKAPRRSRIRKWDNSDFGTLIRSAQALGWQGVFLLKNGQIDLLDPLTIRSSQNSLATLPYQRGESRAMVEFSRRNNLLMCNCAEGGLDLEGPEFAEMVKRHNGVFLLAGHIPPDIYASSVRISIGGHANRDQKRAKAPTSCETRAGPEGTMGNSDTSESSANNKLGINGDTTTETIRETGSNSTSTDTNSCQSNTDTTSEVGNTTSKVRGVASYQGANNLLSYSALKDSGEAASGSHSQAGRRYSIDPKVQAAIAMYLIKAKYFRDAPLSPFSS